MSEREQHRPTIKDFIGSKEMQELLATLGDPGSGNREQSLHRERSTDLGFRFFQPDEDIKAYEVSGIKLFESKPIHTNIGVCRLIGAQMSEELRLRDAETYQSGAGDGIVCGRNNVWTADVKAILQSPHYYRMHLEVGGFSGESRVVMRMHHMVLGAPIVEAGNTEEMFVGVTREWKELEPQYSQKHREIFIPKDASILNQAEFFL